MPFGPLAGLWEARGDRIITRVHIPTTRRNGEPYVLLNDAGRYTLADGVAYIGRRGTTGGYDLPDSPWKNPYRMKDYGREPAVAMYGERLRGHEELLARLWEIDGKVLACWCHPDEVCHGDVLLEILTRKIPSR